VGRFPEHKCGARACAWRCGCGPLLCFAFVGATSGGPARARYQAALEELTCRDVNPVVRGF
jgi:hypothetical protein